MVGEVESIADKVGEVAVADAVDDAAAFAAGVDHAGEA